MMLVYADGFPGVSTLGLGLRVWDLGWPVGTTNILFMPGLGPGFALSSKNGIQKG